MTSAILNKLTLLLMCGFIAQLVEHRTGIAEVMGSNPVKALIFFSGFFLLLKLENLDCDDHTSLSSTIAVQIWIISYIFQMIGYEMTSYQQVKIKLDWILNSVGWNGISRSLCEIGKSISEYHFLVYFNPFVISFFHVSRNSCITLRKTYRKVRWKMK